MMSLVAFFFFFFFFFLCCPFLPRDVLDEISDLIESVSEGFLTYVHTEVLKLKQLELNSSEHKTNETATKVPSCKANNNNWELKPVLRRANLHPHLPPWFTQFS